MHYLSVHSALRWHPSRKKDLTYLWTGKGSGISINLSSPRERLPLEAHTNSTNRSLDGMAYTQHDVSPQRCLFVSSLDYFRRTHSQVMRALHVTTHHHTWYDLLNSSPYWEIILEGTFQLHHVPSTPSIERFERTIREKGNTTQK